MCTASCCPSYQSSHRSAQGSLQCQPTQPAPAGVPIDGYLRILQSLQVLHRKTSTVDVNMLKSITIYEANEELKLGLLIVFSEDKVIINNQF